MSKLIYLDLLQMVTPGEQLDSNLFDFYVFGSFDALKVEQNCNLLNCLNKSDDISSLHKLHTISKERRLKVPVRFDKQSMHLYTLDNNAGNIFRKDGEYASRPLVLTLIQLNDYRINQMTPAALIDEFKQEIQKLQDSDELKAVAFEVFFCLGEPDLVIAFRHTGLTEIASLIYRIRLLTPKGTENGICVLSTSSHCAFPNSSNHEKLKENINTWFQMNPAIRFFTFFDTSYGLDDNNKRADAISDNKYLFDRMLLGDWDYVREWNNSNATDILPDLILEPVIRFDENETGSFKSSWSVPVIKLSETDSKFVSSDRKLSSIMPTVIPEDYEGDETVFSELSDTVKSLTNIYKSDDVTQVLSDKVVSMHVTLIGILKHLCQLRDGRFQYDLYSFVFPAFAALPRITKNTSDLINRINSEYELQTDEEKRRLQYACNETISGILNSYIHDMSRLLAELQHLFSVLSMSPHTYMESFGSNMRSITATCKLLVAYQGIAYSLSRKFDMTMIKDGEKNVSANEVMLVVPYRRIRQNTRVLFEYSSPEDRVVYIRINASDMFHVQKTLFLLLHECGHHILNYDFRAKRVRYYFDAYIGYLLDQGFSAYYKDPFTSLQMTWIDAEVPDDKVSLYKIIHIKHTEEDGLRKAIIQAIIDKQSLGSMIEEFWNTDFKNLSRQQVLSEPMALENNFIKYVKEASCYYIEDRLTRLKKAEEDESDIGDLGKQITAIVKDVVLRLFRNVVDDEYVNRRDESDNELWHLSEFRTIYQEFPEEIIKKAVHKICVDMIGTSYKDVADELKMIFSDIYSDIFAITTLGIGELPPEQKKNEAEKYLALLRDESSFLMKQELNYNNRMTRIFAVLEAGMGIDFADIKDMLRRVLLMRESEIEELQYTIRMRVGYQYVLDYTKKLCVPSIREQIRRSQELYADTEQLKKMYRSEEDQHGLSTMMDAIYYFWKASTQREG